MSWKFNKQTLASHLSVSGAVFSTSTLDGFFSAHEIQEMGGEHSKKKLFVKQVVGLANIKQTRFGL